MNLLPTCLLKYFIQNYLENPKICFVNKTFYKYFKCSDRRKLYRNVKAGRFSPELTSLPLKKSDICELLSVSKHPNNLIIYLSRFDCFDYLSLYVKNEKYILVDKDFNAFKSPFNHDLTLYSQQIIAQNLIKYCIYWDLDEFEYILQHVDNLFPAYINIIYYKLWQHNEHEKIKILGIYFKTPVETIQYRVVNAKKVMDGENFYVPISLYIPRKFYMPKYVDKKYIKFFADVYLENYPGDYSHAFQHHVFNMLDEERIDVLVALYKLGCQFKQSHLIYCRHFCLNSSEQFLNQVLKSY